MNQRPKKWINRVTFRRLLVVTFSLGILMLALMSTFVTTSLSSQSVKERLGHEGLSLAETFAERSRVALLYRSASDAKYVADAMLAFPDVLAVGIYDDTKEQLYSSGYGTSSETTQWSWPESTSLDYENENVWHFVAPVYTGSQADEESPFLGAEMPAELVGYVRIQLGKASLQRMEADIFRYNIAALGLLATALLLILLAITNRITKPIANLAESMRQAREGAKDVRAEVKGTRDVIEMEIAFNSMMNAIKSREMELRSTRDMALEAARVKGEFAANVSHELRTPLNGVLGMLELLSEMGLTNKQREYVEIASGSADSLLSLIDDILDFSKVDSGKYEVDAAEFVLRDMLEEIVVLLGPQAQRKDLDLAYVTEPGVPDRLSGDCGRLRQVLINLIGNALKFTDRGEVGIEVSVVQLKDNTARLRFNVFDTGIGMEGDVLEKIFEAFSQADGSTTRKYGGTGLGLAISRQLVEVMGGEIGVESEPGEGSNFWFTLPFACDAAENTVVPVQSAVESKPLRVLVADDSRLNRRYLAQLLDSENLDYEVVTSGLEALDRLRSASRDNTPFDLAIIDEIMPGIKGPDLGHLIVNDSAVASTRIIMMVNRANPSDQDKNKLNLAGILSKPIQRKDLSNLLAEFKVLTNRPSETTLSHGTDLTVASFSGNRVLVVEDNRANQLVAIGMLERLGCKGVIANNGLEALELIAREEFDLVLMDCHMPEMDGYEATAQIRRLESSASELPIVAMTANVQKGESEKCLAVGMSDYLPKPLKLDELRKKMSDWLQATEYAAIGVEEEIEEQDESASGGILDREAFDELSRHMGDSLGTMVRVFLDDLPTYLRSLRDAVAVNDANAFADIAHSIRGTASNFGAQRLVRVCEELEAKGRDNDDLGVDELVDQAVHECGLLQQALEASAVMDGVASLPDLQGESSDEESQGESATDEPAEQRILLVDDDRGMRFAMRKVLEEDGYRVDEVSNGEQALIYCERFMPDLVLMDAIMPEMDGFRACAEIQALPCGKGVPVLIITALNDETSIGRAFAAGAIDYISKPVNFAVLRKRIARILQASRAEKYVHQLAYNDTLTGLPNRTMFTERLTEIVTAQTRDQITAVLFLDLDRFKLVNDTFGHDAGDLLIKVVAERLLGCVRQGDIVSRFGGDEFTILLHKVKSSEVVKRVAEKILQTLSRPFVFLGKEMHVSTSIGIAMYPKDGNEIGTLLKNADIAMYRAKTQGDCYQFYDKTMEVDVARRLGIENDLRGAIERGEMKVYYQPQRSLENDELIGMEALVRWEHPTRGLVLPGDFIPLAEETGQIIELGEWVMQTACAQLKAWLDAGHQRIRVAVNLAGRQLDGGSVAERTDEILKTTGLEPELLELEITESTIMEDAESVIGTLNDLKSMGIMLAVDDFGTGYSSLNYLKRFPIDMLKIDRAFVSDITSNKVDADIVVTIIALAHSLGVKVIAEGVEDSLQQQFLKNHGCDYIQGYLLGKPVPAEVFEDQFLRKKISAA